MSNVWERFNGIADANEVNEAKSTFEPLKAGNYTATLQEIAPSESQNGLPMLKGKFKLDNGRIAFYNQMLQNLNNPKMTAVNISEAVSMVDKLTGTEVEFTSLGALAERVSGIELGKSYGITISYGKNDTEMKFPKIRVNACLTDNATALEDVDVPFC